MFARGNGNTTRPEELRARDDAEIIDVREPDEWRAGLEAWSRVGLPLASTSGAQGRVI